MSLNEDRAGKCVLKMWLCHSIQEMLAFLRHCCHFLFLLLMQVDTTAHGGTLHARLFCCRGAARCEAAGWLWAFASTDKFCCQLIFIVGLLEQHFIVYSSKLSLFIYLYFLLGLEHHFNPIWNKLSYDLLPLVIRFEQLCGDCLLCFWLTGATQRVTSVLWAIFNLSAATVYARKKANA